MPDVALLLLFLTDYLEFLLLRAVIVILRPRPCRGNAAAVRRSQAGFLIAAAVFYAAIGTEDLLAKADFLSVAIVGMQVAVPTGFFTNVAEARQAAGADSRIVVKQLIKDGVTSDGFHFSIFKKQLLPGVAFDI